MTEVEKKQNGEIYDARDPEIRSQYNRGKDWAKTYNSLPATDAQAKDMILRLFLGSVGKNVRINQPFSVDYGYNITVGNNSFINMNCTLLDAGPISYQKLSASIGSVAGARTARSRAFRARRLCGKH